MRVVLVFTVERERGNDSSQVNNASVDTAMETMEVMGVRPIKRRAEVLPADLEVELHRVVLVLQPGHGEPQAGPELHTHNTPGVKNIKTIPLVL